MMTTMKHAAQVVLVLLGVFAGTAMVVDSWRCGRNVAAQEAAPQLPPRTVPDTRQLVFLRISSTLPRVVGEGITRHTETGYCLYGFVHSDTLFVSDILEGEIRGADSTEVTWRCGINPYY